MGDITCDSTCALELFAFGRLMVACVLISLFVLVVEVASASLANAEMAVQAPAAQASTFDRSGQTVPQKVTAVQGPSISSSLEITPTFPMVTVLDRKDGCREIRWVDETIKSTPGKGATIIECAQEQGDLDDQASGTAAVNVPPAPTLISPVDNSALNTLIPVLVFQVGVSNVPISPRVQLSLDTSFSQSTGALYCGWTENEFSHFLYSNLRSGTRYYWRARSAYGNACNNPNAEWGPWSSVFSFVTGSGGTFLPGPQLLSPPNNSWVPDRKPTFTWQTVPGALGTAFHGQMVSLPDNSWGVYWWSTVSTYSRPWFDLDLNQPYEWWVQFRNDYAWGQNSVRWRFTVGTASTISGQVVDTSGRGIAGVAVSDGGTHTTTTASDGRYTISELPNGTYAISAAKGGYTFSPGSRSVTVPPNATDINFTGSGNSKISGRVRGGGGSGIAGVTISDGAGHSTTSDANGSYSFGGLTPGTYTITPSKTGYAFSPSSQNISVPPDGASIDFSGTGNLIVSGAVRDANTTPIAGVTISDGAGHTATTNAGGSYTLSGLLPGTYAITPSKSGYVFCLRTRSVTVPASATGQDFTGYLATESLGFCPTLNGYAFSNSDGGWGTYPDSADDLGQAEMIRMFGQDAVCATVSTGACKMRSAAERWLDQRNRDMNRGHSDGFTTTGLRFFRNLDSPGAFQTGATSAYDLSLASVRRHIAYYWVRQVPNPVAQARANSLESTPADVLNQLRAAMAGGATDPTTLVLVNADHTSGHSVTPYAIEDRGGGLYWVWVVDSNHPGDGNRHVTINTAGNTWRYNLGWTTWSGDAGSHSLGVIPISIYAQQPVCPWCESARATDVTPFSQMTLSGDAHLLISDPQGRRIGFVNGLFVDEIPVAFGSVAAGGLGQRTEPAYYLPADNAYTILLSGQTPGPQERLGLSQYGPGYAIGVDDLTVTTGSQDRLTIPPDGKQLSYRAGTQKSATLTIAHEKAGESIQFWIKGADLGAGQATTVTVSTATGQLVYANTATDNGDYSLFIRRVRSAGLELFAHSTLAIGADETHYVDYGAWNGSDGMALGIDRDSNGTIDETVVLENQIRSIFLPVTPTNR